MYVPQGILRGPSVPVVIRSISGCEKVSPLPPEKFGGHRVSVGEAYLPYYLRIHLGICDSLPVFHPWIPVPWRKCRWSMGQTEVWSEDWIIVGRCYHPPQRNGAQGSIQSCQVCDTDERFF